MTEQISVHGSAAHPIAPRRAARSSRLGPAPDLRSRSAGPRTEPPVRAAVLARDELVRRGLLDVLGTHPALALTPVAGHPAQLGRLAEESLVDAVVLDVDAREASTTIEEVCALKRRHPWLAVVLLAGDLGEDDALAAVSGGVDALVSRSSPIEDLCAVLARVAQGEPALDRHYAGVLMRALRRREEAPGASLTAREREVLGLVALGRRNSDIARRLFISESTVKFHLRNISDKLGATSRAEVVSIAIRLGLA